MRGRRTGQVKVGVVAGLEKNKRIYVSVSQVRQAATGLVDAPDRKWNSPKAYLGQALVQFEQGVPAG